MSRGYIGQRTRKRSRYRLLFFFLILLIGFIIFFANHIMDPNEDLEEIDEFIFNDEDSVSIQKLETELLGLKQGLILREKLISSLKNQIKFYGHLLGLFQISSDEWFKNNQKILTDKEKEEIRPPGFGQNDQPAKPENVKRKVIEYEKKDKFEYSSRG